MCPDDTVCRQRGPILYEHTFWIAGRWTPRAQGDAGEISAFIWLTQVGALVAKPFLENPGYDLVADFVDGRPPQRVEVKTSTCWPNERYEATLAARGANQSWNGVVKLVDATRCDYLSVHVGDGRRWFIPTGDLGGGSGILLSGPKYAAYEVQPGAPLQSRSDVTG